MTADPEERWEAPRHPHRHAGQARARRVESPMTVKSWAVSCSASRG